MWVVVTAAGASRRMGGGNKLLLPLAGKPLLIHTLEYFQRHDLVTGMVVSAPPDQCQLYQQLFSQYQLTKVVRVVAGGTERQDSIRHALETLNCAPETVVAIHDGARPYLNQELLQHLLEALVMADGTLPVVAVKDTIKRLDEQGRVMETLMRQELYAAQTPQVFRYQTILQAHYKARDEGFLATDDCSLIEHYGGSIKTVTGDYRNLKVTTPEDVERLAGYV